MADSRDLLVRILGDDRSLQQAFTRTEKRTHMGSWRTCKMTWPWCVNLMALPKRLTNICIKR